jgi:hypothetical protein
LRGAVPTEAFGDILRHRFADVANLIRELEITIGAGDPTPSRSRYAVRGHAATTELLEPAHSRHVGGNALQMPIPNSLKCEALSANCRETADRSRSRDPNDPNG